MSETTVGAANTTNATAALFQDYIQDDAVCCLISVSGSAEPDGFSFVEVSMYQIQGHGEPSRWQRLKQAWRGRRPFLEFYNRETLDRFIVGLQEARKSIFKEAGLGEKEPDHA